MKLLFIFGTRPEAIKLAPLILQAQQTTGFEPIVCTTGQHKEMLDQVLEFFSITPHFELGLMKKNQDLTELTGNALIGLNSIIKTANPDLIIVQGDTTTAFVGALAAFYNKIKIAHVEAGLRSNDLYSPYPEEGNRQLIARIAAYHFAPTTKSKKSLLDEHIEESSIYEVGNTVIDALLEGQKLVLKNSKVFKSKFNFINPDRKFVLITGHRRESFGEPFQNICEAILFLAKKFESVDFIYPVHLNPNVQQVVYETLNKQTNIHLIDPVSYPEMIWLMDQCYFVLTDSGGIQEEAPSLGKPVLVMREVTERTEGIDAGTAKLVGTDKNEIIMQSEALLTDHDYYDQMAKAVNPYGDGTTSQQIIRILEKEIK